MRGLHKGRVRGQDDQEHKGPQVSQVRSRRVPGGFNPGDKDEGERAVV